MRLLNGEQEKRLRALLSALIDQRQARVLVVPHRQAPGFWFGGGNLVADRAGAVWMSGRYRNYGDSRTGLKAGERGLECAVFRSVDGGHTFEKVRSWSKADLSVREEVLSIEGTSLHLRAEGNWELFVSSEKALSYPAPVERYQKAGTGIWTIDRMTAASPETLGPATLVPVLPETRSPEYLHVKDPVVFDRPGGGTSMLFCSHPYSWTSSNSGWATRAAQEPGFQVQDWQVVTRGTTWDVAVTRVTGRLSLPQVGCLAGQPPCAIYFYDGAECVHHHEQDPHSESRPRGYSCEEIGGAFFGWDAGFPVLERLSSLAPIFVSPWGTGASRYASTLVTSEGILATWEQSQEDGSQPLVGHLVPMDEAERILAS